MTVERTHALLTPRQLAAVERVLAEESERREQVAVALTGAHAYGYPGPTSDLDLEAVHLDDARTLLGFPKPAAPIAREVQIEGVDVDYASSELGAVLHGVLEGNGRHLEQFLSGFVVAATPLYLELITLVRGAVSQKVVKHYAAEAAKHRQAWEASARRELKPLLATLRATLTGTHLLRTGEMQTDVSLLFDDYGFSEGHGLVAQRTRGSSESVDEALAAEWARRLPDGFALLDQAVERSVLPQEPANAADLEQFLVEHRLQRLREA